MKDAYKGLFFVFVMVISCTSESKNFEKIINIPDDNSEEEILVEETPTEKQVDFYLGADLSYVNEMEDCGAKYYDLQGVQKDPYKIFVDQGANLVRLRLWHTPDWTDYSTLEDVKKSIRTVKDLGMQVLLDFHYSDTWADPSKQQIPAAWLDDIENTEHLGERLYAYTFTVLEELQNENLLPEIVQVGNEINAMLLQDGEPVWPIDWERNSALINKGIKAVRDISVKYETAVAVMLHIAQPENGLWWFEQATANGVIDFDWIGISYYPKWSEYGLNEVDVPLNTLIDRYQKRLMIVETAYPFTMQNVDAANNILGENALVEGYEASPEGQLAYLLKLKDQIEKAGGEGLIYWEPAWVSTNCNTLWGIGSHWDNATMFDQENKAHEGIQFYNESLKE